MRKALTLALMCLLVVPVAAETYKVRVKRIDRNLYRDNQSKAIIETRLCLELALDDAAILRWEGRYGDNWLLFVESGEKCDVVGVYAGGR
jgi:hypothetical protein